MSSINKRSRGRPVGTGTDDRGTLKKVADIIMASPSVRVTTAAKRVLEAPNPSTIRRLQVKWRSHGAEYLSEARARRAVTLAPTRRVGAMRSPRTLRQFVQAQLAMHEADAPRMRMLEKMMNSPEMLAAREVMRRHQESPEMLAMREAARRFEASPGMQAIRQLQNSPVMQKLQQMQNDPRLQMLQQTQAEVRRAIVEKMGEVNAFGDTL